MKSFINFMLFRNLSARIDYVLALLSWGCAFGMLAVLTWVVFSIIAIYQITR